MKSNEKRLWELRDKYAPDTPRGMRIAAKLAEKISKQRELDTAPIKPVAPAQSEPSYAGIEVFEDKPVATDELVIVPTYRPLPEAAPLPEQIERFEDPRALPYMMQILEDLGKATRVEDVAISESTKTELANAPFSPEFRKTMENYAAVQKKHVETMLRQAQS